MVKQSKQDIETDLKEIRDKRTIIGKNIHELLQEKYALEKKLSQVEVYISTGKANLEFFKEETNKKWRELEALEEAASYQ